MKAKLKIAILTLLGFSTACCAQKKAAKSSQDQEPPRIEADSIDTRIMLMYGVPNPDGRVAIELTEEEAKKRVEEVRAEEERMKQEAEAKAAESEASEAETATETATQE